MSGLPAVVLAVHTALVLHTLLNALLLRRVRPGATVTERVSVLLPLRDEAARVTPCLESLLGQRGVPNLTIVALDDNSTDGTAEVVRQVAGDKITLLAGEPLPPGWLGKPHACAQLAREAEAAGADVLVFVDADVTLAPDAIAGAVALLREAKADLLAPHPRIVGAGRLIQPLLQWSWLTFLPVRLMEIVPHPAMVAAGGQWLVADRAAYERAGGHGAVRGDVLEDMGLARAFKRSGARVALADGSRVADCLMYSSWRDLADGYGKSLWAAFGSAAGAAAVILTLLLLYAAPPAAALVLALTGPAGAAITALTAYLLGVAGRVIAAAATGGRTWPDPLAQPISVLALAALVVRSFARRRRGRLTWKGRTV